MAAIEFCEAWNAVHDPQRAEPSGYCRECGGEIYSDEALYEYDGLCELCHLKALEPDPDEPRDGERCGNCAKRDKCGTEPDDYCRYWEETE